MRYTIFRNKAKLITVRPESGSVLSQKKGQEDIVRLNFTLVEPVEIKIGDYIIIGSQEIIYRLNKKPRQVESPKDHKYEGIFEGPIHEFKKVIAFLNTPKTSGGFYRDYSFPLTGNAKTFLSFIVGNLNRNGGAFIEGAYEETGNVTINFNKWDVFQSITEITSELGIDWYLSGNTLNFASRTDRTSYVFQTGRKSGFVSLTRLRVENKNLETVVYGYGSSSNLPPRSGTGLTYDGDNLTQNRLSFSGDDGESKLSNNVAVYGTRESVQVFDDVKPEYTGEVTAINASNRREFFDTGIDFNINDQIIEGLFPKVVWLSGSLIGQQFNISFDDSTKKATMDIIQQDSDSLPNDVIYPKVGDAYTFVDLAMPDSYIQAAELRLKEATQAYLDENSKTLEAYQGDIEKEYIQKSGIELFLGDIVRIISPIFGIDNYYEINSLTQNLLDLSDYSIGFGDVLPLGLINTLKLNTFTTNNSISNIQKNTVNNTQITNIQGETTSWQNL